MRGRIIPWLLLCLGIAPLTTACMGMRPPGPPTTQELRIGSDARTGCPARVTPAPTAACTGLRGGTCVAKGDQLLWAGERAFRVHFDPLASAGIANEPCVGRECKTRANPISDSAPPSGTGDPREQVKYKYTVVVDGCPPLDPPIFIQR